MHALIRWFIHNPVAANLIMALILISGALSVYSMRIEGFPKLPADTIAIETVFLDAHTEQVDEHITQKIENALEGLQGVKHISSSSLDGLSTVKVRKIDGYDLQRLLGDVRLRMDGIASLPSTAEKPVITRNEFNYPALYLQLYGDVDFKTLQFISKQLRDTLLEQAEISHLNVWGIKAPEITIEILPEVLEKYKLTMSDVTEKIQNSSLLYKAGVLKTTGGHISIRADKQAYYQHDFESIAIFENSEGSRVLLGDIAQVKDDFEDDDVIVRFNGQQAIGIEILIANTENVLDISRAAKRVVSEFETTLPDTISLTVWGDSSNYISERLNSLKNNALQGLLLVVVILALFLDLRLAFWVALGIPISITGALAMMGTSWVDYSLNDVTTFGLIIALGILVDDAVVVGESVFEQRKQQKSSTLGTAKGVERVATATIFGVLTTVAAFFPMLLIDNALGKVMASFAGVVIFALLFSLFESKFILPAHLAYTPLEQNKRQGLLIRTWKQIQDNAQAALHAFKTHIYTPVLRWSIQQRYAVIIVFLSIALFGIGLIGYGKIKTVFFPDIPGQVITVNMEMDARSPHHLILKNVDHIEAIAKDINESLRVQHKLNEGPIQNMLVVIVSNFSAEIYAELTPVARRNNIELNTLNVLKQWQEQVGTMEGVTDLSFTGSEEAAGGFEVKLLSKDEDALRSASKELLAYLHNIGGVSNVRDSLKNGKPEIHLVLKPQAQHLGFTTERLAQQIGARFGGLEAQRIQRESREVRVIVKNAKQAREKFSDLINVRLMNEDGHWIPLSAIAEFKSSYAVDYLSRFNGKRENSIQAFIDKTIVAPTEIAQSITTDFLPLLKSNYPQVELKFAGELEQEGELKGSLLRALLLTCVLIYVLLALPLKSYWQPFVIISVVPFGFIGAAAGHLIMDLPLSILSFFGMLALTGVVVNDSLVMITRYNQARADGIPKHDALIDAGVGRFQAIFLTTVTTVAGLMPLMAETSEQAQYLIPAAVSLAYGEIFATTLTLILIPVLIAVGEDIGNFFATETKQTTIGKQYV